MRNFVLASQSPRRQELLNALGLSFRILIDTSPETVDFTKSPKEIVKELALQKAQNVFSDCKKEEIILSADTMVTLNGVIFGKPDNQENAREMLKTLSGNTHEVYTGFCIMDKEQEKIHTDYECTQVTFKNLSNDEIESYISTGEPLDKAGAYGIQGLGSLFIEKINGDYYNVMGLPLCKLGKILNTEFEISIL